MAPRHILRIDPNILRQIIMSQFVDDTIDEDIYEGYSEDHFENENQQAFLDAGHFYGFG